MKNARAFTLIELLITLVIGGIVAAVSVSFISQASRSLVDTGSRQQLAGTGAIISEQISRRLRQALPGSVRTTSDRSCVEFMPLLAASAYTELEVSKAISSLVAVPYSTVVDVTGYMSVFPLTGNLYNPGTTGPLTPFTATLPAGSAPTNVSFSQPHRFPSGSPQQRLFVSAQPQAICQDGEWLYLYSGYGFINSVAQLKANLPSTFAGGREVLANGLLTDSLEFRFTPPTLQRNGLVTLRFTLSGTNGDQLTMAQEVQVRNVP